MTSVRDELTIVQGGGEGGVDLSQTQASVMKPIMSSPRFKHFLVNRDSQLSNFVVSDSLL